VHRLYTTFATLQPCEFVAHSASARFWLFPLFDTDSSWEDCFYVSNFIFMFFCVYMILLIKIYFTQKQLKTENNAYKWNIKWVILITSIHQNVRETNILVITKR